jgi:two-component system, cell cycle response regulator CpdR
MVADTISGSRSDKAGELDAADGKAGKVGETRKKKSVSRVAIAEDDPDSLELMCMALRSPKTEIREASNGADLLQLLGEDGPFDLIVTDIHMPWMEGLQVLRAARSAELETPVLVVTGQSEPGLQAKVDRIGNARLLHKPFGIPELRDAVADLMAAQG